MTNRDVEPDRINFYILVENSIVKKANAGSAFTPAVPAL